MIENKFSPESYNREIASSLEKKEKGKNIKLIIKLGRHAEKEPSAKKIEGLLSKEGEASASEYGASLSGQEKYGMKGYSSKQPRAERTRDIIGDNAPRDFTQLKPRSREELDYKNIRNLPKGGWAKYQKIFLEEKYPNFDDLSFEDKYRAMQEAEDYMCNVMIEDEKYVEEAASRVAHFLDVQIRMADRLDNGSRAILVDISHNSPLTAFLKKCLIRKDRNSGQENRGFDNVAEIGGSFKPMEFFELEVEIDEKGSKKITPKFENPERLKGDDWSFDFDELKRLSSLYKENKKDDQKENSN